jgi:hypothetical protein
LTTIDRNIKVFTIEKFKALPEYKEWEALNKIVRDAVNRGDISPALPHIDRECTLYQELMHRVKNQQ